MFNKIISKISENIDVSVQGLIKYLHNSSWFLIERAYAMVLSLFIGIAVARYLGPENYGKLSYAIVIYAITLNLALLGLDDLIMREVLNRKAAEGRILGTVFFIRVCSSIIFFISAMIFAIFVAPPELLPIIGVVTASVLLQPISIISLFFLIEVRTKLKTVAMIFSLSICAVIKIALIISKVALIYFALTIFLETLLFSLAIIYIYKRSGYNFDYWIIDRSLILPILKKGAPMMIVVVVATIFTKIDMIMVEKYLGSEQLGIYSVSVKLMEIWVFIPIILTSSFIPSLVNTKTNFDITKYKKRISQLLVLLTWGFIIFCIFTTIFAKPIVTILFGNQYIEATTSLQIIIWVLLYLSIFQVTIKMLIIDNMLSALVIRCVIGLILNIILNIILIPIYGINGAAISTLISYIIISYFIDIFFKSSRELFFMKSAAIFLPLRYFRKK